MDLEIRALTDEEEEARAAGLEMARRFVDGALPLTLPQVQEIYDLILHEYPNFAEGRIALGIAFGELIAAKADFEWVRVTDEFGSETALAPRGVHGACHPISMIQKRIDRGEETDVAELRDATIDLIRTKITDGHWARRDPKSLH